MCKRSVPDIFDLTIVGFVKESLANQTPRIFFFHKPIKTEDFELENLSN